MQELHVKIWNRETDVVGLAVLRFEPADAFIELTLPDGDVFSGTKNDLFDALIYIRERLEMQGLFVLCNGSRLDVTPSRMSRQMSNGRRAYQMKMGEQARLPDLVDIFDETSRGSVATVADQRRFYRQWLESLG